MGINVETKAVLEAADPECLTAGEVKTWIAAVPNGATISPVLRDFGSQRDPDVRLAGLRATWSGTVHAS